MDNPIMKLRYALFAVVLAVCTHAHAQAPSVNSDTGDLGPYCAAPTGSDFGFQIVCTPPNSTVLTSGDTLFVITYYGMHGSGVMYCAQPSFAKTSALYPLVQISPASNTTLTVYASSTITTNANAMTFQFVCKQ